MNVSPHMSPSPPLTLWKPTPTVISGEWVQLMEQLIQQTRGKPHPYIMETKYDAQRVGDRLRSWGLPWDVVMAGYLWEYDRETVQRSQLCDAEKVITHILHATAYLGYIRDDNLPPLLTPPYDDLGGLLIAIAIYYEAFQALQTVSHNRPLRRTLRSEIERVERTLISITKKLGMWHFKREIEDITEQLCNPLFFADTKKEYDHILERDWALLEHVQQWLMNTYREVTHSDQITITFIPCGVAGLKRRKQDANIIPTTENRPLNGFDLSTFEVIVPTVADCYSVFGVFKQLGLFKDNADTIAAPKTNGYSHVFLHLQLVPESDYTWPLQWLDAKILPCKMQIATTIMQAVTWYGPLYPDYYRIYTESVDQDLSALPPLESLWQSESGKVFATLHKNIVAPRPPLDSKMPIVVYQSKNRIPVPLPKGATALDFAFTLDRSIGAHAVYAIVNNRSSPLHRVLDADDTVEIVTSTEIQAQKMWLQPTHSTIPAVRKQIRKSLRDHTGYKLLRQELERYHYVLPPEALEEQLSTLARQNSLGTVHSYLERLDPSAKLVFTPQWAAQQIMQRLAYNDAAAPSVGHATWIPVIDTQLAEDKRRFQRQRFCRLCRPDKERDAKIMGRVRKRDNTLVIHKASCPSLLSGATPSLLPMVWQLQPPLSHVAFYIAAQDRRGLILDLTRQLWRYDCDLLSLNAEAVSANGKAGIHFTIGIHSDNEVLDILEALRTIGNLITVDIDAAATPTQVYDRLQHLSQQKGVLSPPPLSEPLDEPASLEPRSFRLMNPFDISRPATASMFFGRSEETDRMRRELCDQSHGRALILYGPRRSGKTSVCINFLEREVRPPLWGVHFSLQNTMMQNEATILEKLADAVAEQYHKQLRQSPPSWEDYSDTDAEDRFRKFLASCIERIAGSRLILVLDEFGGALESHRRHNLEDRFFSYWKELIETLPQLSLVCILPTSAHKQLTSKKFANAFSFAQNLPLEFLDAASARQLLADPLREQNIHLSQNAGPLAVKLTGGNPYYMTLIGQELINYLNIITDQQIISAKDLHSVSEQLIHASAPQNFDFLRDELQHPFESAILETIVEFTSRTRETKMQLKQIASRLHLSPSVVQHHLHRLRAGLILDEVGRPPNVYYSFKIDLVRKWLISNRWFFANERQR